MDPTLSVIVCNDEFVHRRYLLNTMHALCAQPGRANARFLFVRVNPHFHFVGSVLFDVLLHETHRRLLALLDRVCAADLKIGVS